MPAFSFCNRRLLNFKVCLVDSAPSFQYNILISYTLLRKTERRIDLKKFMKVMAVIMAVLMLVTMATACKQSDEFDDIEFEGGEVGGEVTENENNTDDPKEESEGNKQESNKTDKEENKKEESNTPPPSSQEQANENYDATKKYDMSNNPLVYEGKAPNRTYKLNFDIDTTGFVKNNIKVADLKGKTLNFLTAVRYNIWEFKNEKGEYVGEWEWFKECKNMYGLNVKYTVSRFDQADQQALTYMNAGKALDIVPTHVGGFPKYLNLSQPLDPYINIQNLDNSPGVCGMTLEQTKWGGTYRCISAIGAVNVLWYNASLVEQFRLQDPHKLWKEGKWDWDAYAAFMKSLPATTPEGKKLWAMRQCDGDIFYSWALTNGVGPIEIDTKSKTPNLINNWMDERVLQAWEFVSTTHKSVAYPVKNSETGFTHLYSDGTLMMADAYNMNPNFDSTEYGKAHKYNWVPYPAATTSTGRCIAFNYGYTMMLAKKMKNQSNAPYAVKFMELWANRFTEANYDFFSDNSSIAMTYADKKDHFEFCVNNTYFGLQMNGWETVTGDNKKMINQFSASFRNPQYNVRTEATAVKNIVEQVIKDCLAFGV